MGEFSSDDGGTTNKLCCIGVVFCKFAIILAAEDTVEDDVGVDLLLFGIELLFFALLPFKRDKN
jgi:hypothetical protein